jgi:hypothetical protein
MHTIEMVVLCHASDNVTFRIEIIQCCLACAAVLLVHTCPRCWRTRNISHSHVRVLLVYANAMRISFHTFAYAYEWLQIVSFWTLTGML